MNSILEKRTGAATTLIALLAGISVASARASDGASVTSSEIPESVSTSFSSLDTDQDGSLSEAEFTAPGGQPAERLSRDFRVFDLDGNQGLSIEEFAAVPYLAPEGRPGAPPDAVMLLADSQRSRLAALWREWDRNSDGGLDKTEFAAANLGRELPGLGMLDFVEWDADQNGQLTLEEAGRLLEVAFGVRAPTGQLLRSPGWTLDWRMFRDRDRDGDGKIPRDEYLQRTPLPPEIKDPQEWFKTIDPNQDGSLDLDELASTFHRLDPTAEFLNLDTNLDGKLTLDELNTLSPDRQVLARYMFPGFDDDGDGGLSLREFQLTPISNLMAVWQAAVDTDHDGRLGLAEFQFAPPPALIGLTTHYFHRLDHDGDGFLSMREWVFQTSHPRAQFIARDTNGDDFLSEDEFVAAGGQPAENLARDFRAFDLDADRRLNLAEFAGIPYLAPAGRPGALPDAVEQLASEHFARITERWTKWDQNGGGALDKAEFTAAKPGREVSGLEMTSLAQWDFDRDGQVALPEAKKLLEIAFGVRAPTGQLLRVGGSIVDWRMFRDRDRDGDGKIPRDEYLRTTPLPPDIQDPVEWFNTIDPNRDGFLDLDELALTFHRLDPAAEFLHLDKNLDGKLTLDELNTLSPDRQVLARFMFPGFDDDGDEALSLREFQLTPIVNLLAVWQSAVDRDHDGKLSLSEFQFAPPPALAALSAEYFRRLDRNGDRFLDVDEWVFSIDAGRAPREVVLRQRDRDGDGRLTFAEVLGDRKPPGPGEPTNPGLESEFMRLEEVFRQADANGDRVLDLQEISTDAGLEVLAPGAAALANQAASVTDPVFESFGLQESPYRLYAILGFNAVLIIGVLLFVLRKPKGS